MTHSPHILVLFLFIGITLQVQAQESINTSSGIVSGIGGEAYYSIGQPIYNSINDGHINVLEGIQQPYTERLAYTLIPDVNFENRLIAMGIDTDNESGMVLTESIASVKDLDLSGREITDLTGLQDFTTLAIINCSHNQITNLNLTNNTYLNTINCSGNQLTSLDITNNKTLIDLNCGLNQLTAIDLYKAPYLKTLELSFNNISYLDISSNKNLVSVFCFSNVLESLDISNNPKVIDLGLSENQLTSLNLKNGNNALLNLSNLRLNNNSDLTCILVDNKSYSDANWLGVLKDLTATYNEECENLSNSDYVFSDLEVYPNPTNGLLTINHVTLNTIEVHNTVGSLVLIQSFDGISTQNTIDLSGLAKGFYMVTLKSKNTITTKKIIVK